MGHLTDAKRRFTPEEHRSSVEHSQTHEEMEVVLRRGNSHSR
ncbi:conserved protein of unknown function [Candidatus Methylacidiphilum fumarolicum]|nr:conserved protein of unknown function [Candidatus Methylacidiphilum fumarolicum]